MSRPAVCKPLLASLLRALAAGGEPERALDGHCHEDCRWEVYHPFETLHGAAAAGFWRTLGDAFPDHEHRAAFLIEGESEGRRVVSSWGHLIGTFERPWLGIPPTHGMIAVRFGVHGIVREGRIARAYVLFDALDLMLQAGVYPFRRMPGSAMQWPFPPCDTGATALNVDAERGAETLRIVREMQAGLPPGGVAMTHEERTRLHSPHWHAQMNWFGPAGIGSGRGLRGFRNVHGALFLQAFPDRAGFPRPWDDPDGAFLAVGDGLYAMTSGHPCLQGMHTGPEWLGLPPTGRVISMRVADWYRLDDQNRIVDNWVMMDIPHMVRQMGLDIFHDLAFAAAPETDRWPEPPLAELAVT